MANQYNDILASQIAEPATSDENLELYTRVVAGDTFARQEMIERNMALVLSKVDSFVASRPSVKYLRDDLVSMGSIGLVNAVNTMAAGTVVENPTGYLGAAIVYELQHLFETEDPIPVSRRSLHRGEDNGDASPGLERVSSTSSRTLFHERKHARHRSSCAICWSPVALRSATGPASDCSKRATPVRRSGGFLASPSRMPSSCAVASKTAFSPRKRNCGEQTPFLNQFARSASQAAAVCDLAYRAN